MTAPRVLVPWPRDVPTSLGRLVTVLAEQVAQALERCGAEVVRLDPTADPDATDREVAQAHGVLLVGGGDVDPRLYGGPVDHPSVDHVDPVRDRAEVAVVEGALRAGVPVLGVCRGAQLLNVALGGTLRAQVDDDVVVHHGTGGALFVQHDVDVRPGTRLDDALGAGPRTVWSGHHQAIDRLAPGLDVVATAADGLVEAVEHREHDLLAVQWHPEHGDPDPPVEPDPLFCDFVERLARSAAQVVGR